MGGERLTEATRGLHRIAEIGEAMLKRVRPDEPRHWRSILHDLTAQIETQLGPFGTELEARMLHAYLKGRLLKPQPAHRRDLVTGETHAEADTAHL